MSEEKKLEEKKGEMPSEEKKDEKKCEGDICKEGCCGIVGGKNIIIWIVIAVLVIGVIAFFQMKKGGSDEAKPVSKKVSEKVELAAMELIEGELVPPGTAVEIGEITEESGLYRIDLKVEEQEVTSYMTKDMNKFIPQLIDVNELEDAEASDMEEPAAEVQAKSPKPEVELFVMSHCPYGTQMEKGFLPVMETLGNKIDAKIKFVDYAMHGEKEVTEQVRQFCIQGNEPNKFDNYLGCFLEEGDAAACDQATSINQTILAQCVAQTNAQYNVEELLADKESYISGQFPQFNLHKEENEKYGVQGSPTLVINGEMIQSGRDSASILRAVCSGFAEQPEECGVELSSASPAPGFGTEAAPAGTDASAEAGCGV